MTPDGIVYRETYRECERCVHGKDEGRDRKRQSMLRCPIVPSARAHWSPPGTHFAVYMGAEGDVGEGEEQPCEDNEDGCPGGWYRTIFAASVRRYQRPMAEGVYSANMLLDRSNDRLVHDAVAYFETEQARHRNYCHDVAQELRAARDR